MFDPLQFPMMGQQMPNAVNPHMAFAPLQRQFGQQQQQFGQPGMAQPQMQPRPQFDRDAFRLLEDDARQGFRQDYRGQVNAWRDQFRGNALADQFSQFNRPYRPLMPAAGA